MLNDPLAACLSKILNAEKTSKTQCQIKPISKEIKKVLSILQDHRYIGEIEEIKEARGDHFVVHLLQKINKCGVIKPRFSVQKDGFEKFEKRYLPAKDFGLLIVSTSQGIVIHNEARDKGVGGKLLAFCY